MFDLFKAISQSSLLNLQPKLGSFQIPQLFNNNNTWHPRFAAVASNRQLHLKGLTVARVVSFDSKTPTIFTNTLSSEQGGTEIEFDSVNNGGDKFEDGRGGGGGGDNSGGGDNGEGEFSDDDGKKKMALSMSHKLTLGYAALVGVGGAMGYMKSGSHKSLAGD